MATLLYFVVCPEKKTDPELFARFCYDWMGQKQVKRLVASNDTEPQQYLQSFSKLLHCDTVIDFRFGKRRSPTEAKPSVKVPEGVQCIRANFGIEDDLAFQDRISQALVENLEGPKVLLLAREVVDTLTEGGYSDAVLLDLILDQENLMINKHVNQTEYLKFENAASQPPRRSLEPPVLGKKEAVLSKDLAPVPGITDDSSFEVTKAPIKSTYLGITPTQPVFVAPNTSVPRDIDLPASSPSRISQLPFTPPLSEISEPSRDYLALAASQRLEINLSQVSSQIIELVAAFIQEIKPQSQIQDFEPTLAVLKENVFETVYNFANSVKKQYENQTEADRKIAANAIEEGISGFKAKTRSFESVFHEFEKQQREIAMLISEVKSALDRSAERHVFTRIEEAIKEIEGLKQAYDKLYAGLPDIKEKQFPLEILDVECMDTEISFNIHNRKPYSLENLTLRLAVSDGDLVSDIPNVAIHPGTKQVSVPLASPLSGSVQVSLLQFDKPVCASITLSLQQSDISIRIEEPEVDISSLIDAKFARVKEMLGGDSISQETNNKLVELRSNPRAEIWTEEIIAKKVMPVG